MLIQFPLSCPLVKIYCEILNNRCKELFTIRRCCKDPRMSMGKYPEPSTLWNSQTLPSVCCLALQILNSTAAHCFQKYLLNKKILGCQGFNGLPPPRAFLFAVEREKSCLASVRILGIGKVGILD